MDSSKKKGDGTPVRSIDHIHPRKLYPLSAVRDRIPSVRQGCRVSRATVVALIGSGQLRGVRKRFGSRTYWFVWGADLLTYLEPLDVASIDSPAQRRRRQERAEKESAPTGSLVKRIRSERERRKAHEVALDWQRQRGMKV